MGIADTVKGIFDGINKDKANEYSNNTSVAMSKAEAEAITSPDATKSMEIFNSRMDEIDAKAKEDLSPEVYDIWKESFDEKITRRRSPLIINSAVRANKQQRESFETSTYEYARNADSLDEVYESIDKAIMFNDDEKATMKSKAHTNFELGRIERTIYSGNAGDVKTMMNYIKSSKYEGPLKGNARAAAINSLENSYSELTAAAREKQEIEEGMIYGNMAIRASRAELTQIEIDNAARKHPEVITASRRKELMMVNARASEEKVDATNRRILVRQAMSPDGLPLDRKNKDHVKAVDEFFNENPTIESGVELTLKTSIMPSLLEAELRSQAFAGSDENVARMANTFEVLQRESPQSLADIGPKESAVYSTVSSLYRGGTPLDKAVEVARKNASIPPEKQGALNMMYQSEAKNIPSRLKNLMDSSEQHDISFWFKGAPKPSPAVVASYSAAEKEYYKWTGGDLEKASKLAFQHINRIFSTTKVNGKQETFAYAPERVYGMESDFLQNDLRAFARKNKIDPERIFVLPDPITARERQVKTYAVWVNNEFDLPEPVDDEEGRQRRWSPDVERYRSIQETKRADRKKKARKQRDVNIRFEKAREKMRGTRGLIFE